MLTTVVGTILSESDRGPRLNYAETQCIAATAYRLSSGGNPTRHTFISPNTKLENNYAKDPMIN